MKHGTPVSSGISLDDKYLLESGRVFMTGVQALVRLPLDRKRLDLKNGLNTAGFISGYRGSPLGGYDQQLIAGKKLTDAHDVKLWEGLNEDLGATAVWGSQQTHLFPGAKFDGVFGIWYGKAPGVGRAGGDQLAAVASGLNSLTAGAARCFGGGDVDQVVVELRAGYMVFMAISDGSSLAVLATKSCDVGMVGYEMSMLVKRMGTVLTPALVNELQATLSRT